MKIPVLCVLAIAGLFMLPIASTMGQPAAELEGPRVFNIKAGKLIKIKSDVMNNTPQVLTFAYIVQIRNSDGATVHLSWMEGIKLTPKDKVQAMQSWIPEKAGEHTVEIFVWESISNPDPMSPVRKAIAVVS